MEQNEMIFEVMVLAVGLIIGFLATFVLLRTTWPSLSRKSRTITSIIIGVILSPIIAYGIFIAWAFATGFHG